MDKKFSVLYWCEWSFEELGIQTYVPEDWRLFVDSSKPSLKCVLLYNASIYIILQHASVPLAHSTTIKHNYEEKKVVLENISYYEHNWAICMDLKMVSYFLGQQSGYKKYPCFICLCDSRDKENHYSQVDYPIRTDTSPIRSLNILHEPLDDGSKILFPTLHNKIGLIK